ncbi:uncharacterized protein Ufm1 isoform X2 [Prorops nasuta]
MSDNNFSEILQMLDVYHAILENPNINKNTTIHDVTKVFHCAEFIEATIKKVYKEEKKYIFECHLYNHCKLKNRKAVYSCQELELACDKILEVYLKNLSLPVSIVDEYLNLYSRSCGQERLQKFFNNTLTGSAYFNNIIKSMEGIGVPASEIEDEALLIEWEHFAKIGHQTEVTLCIHKMLSDGLLSKILSFANELPDDSETKKLIVKILISKVSDNDLDTCLEFSNIEEEVFLTFVKNNTDFSIYYLDAIFYFGRNMKKEGDKWISNNQFTYASLVKIFKTLLYGPNAIYDVVYKRLQLAQKQLDYLIWNDIEEDCK